MLGMATSANNFVNNSAVNDVVLNCPKDFIISHGSTEMMAQFKDDSSVELYCDSTRRLQTTSSGVQITGALNVTTTMYIPDGSTGLQIGSSNDMIMYHNGSNSFIQHQGTGSLYIDSLNNSADIYIRSEDNLHLMTNNNAQNSVVCVGNSGVILYNQGNARFNTDNDGAVVTEKRLAINRNAGDPYVEFQTSGTSNIALYGGASSGFRVFTKPSGGSLTERLKITNDGVAQAYTLSGSYYPIASVRDGSTSARAAQSAWEIKKTLGPAARDGYYLSLIHI